ncbi:tropinone reductase homolog At2g29340-like isoform X2 [Humulus lupulus]|uniref:tropinone reductase homolog At2g29340-like isoform X2 n=1 Tax=Humulus lupulus TaxID=3486 RepID=UPI002B404232|nr:tropinone reductase homolog At2g29340-like isoform X2 [Humulus lupulus]
MENNCWQQRWSLKGKTALVTGGSRGLGHAIVEELASFGAIVHTCCLDQTELDQSLEEWKRKGFQVTGSVCDVLFKDQRDKLMQTVSSLFQGKLNILVNAVGKPPEPKVATEFSGEDISMAMGINFESAYHLSQLSHPLMKAAGNGSIVFNSSVAGIMAFPGGSIYSAAKEKGIAELIEKTPLRRMGLPNETSSVVAFLCLPAASYVTGQLLCIDGGFTASGFPISSLLPTN